MILCANRIPYGKIYLSAEENTPQSPVRYAAKELRWYLGRMTAASFEIAEPDGGMGIYLSAASGLSVADLGDDGFAIETDNTHIRIHGGRRGLLYGVYEWLERLGCRFFTATCEKIPTCAELYIPELHVRQKPVFEYREHNYADVVQNVRFAVKCRLNGNHHRIPESMGGYMPYAWFVHSFERMISTAEFGKTHPEYFALVDGKRVVTDGGRTQLCLSNPDVLRICIERTRAELLRHPEARIISISQNDWGGNCQCEACRRTDAEEGSPSGTMLRFVNAVADALAEEFPNVLFDTLAYQYTRPAPLHTRNHKNVCVRLCSIECCFSHTFEACDDTSRRIRHPDGTVSRFADDLKNWGKICDRLYLWDYTTNFDHYPAPHPNWRVLQPNLQFIAQNNGKGVFEQANGASRGGVDFNELRLYLISKLLWNPYCDIEQHRKEFLEYYYGAAAPYLDEYLNLLCDIAERENIHISFNQTPDIPLFREEHMRKYEALFDRAAETVQGDALRLYRVEKARLSIRYVRLKRETVQNRHFDIEAIERFTSDWRAYGLSRAEEWFNFENTHRAILDGHWRAREYFQHWTDEEPEIF